ncbi:MAG TPA: hypothetical protein VFS52_25170 [Steroidobacteraceae bacterium]|jgi:hypothetical protein|nr:hypothetical protein [Steroidobacteraceae bacterium]
MFTTRKSDTGADSGKWYAMVIEGRGARRVGYCAIECTGHESSEAALEHYLQYQLDRESALWLDRRAQPANCEICGERTTLRARLGRDTKPFVLCLKHQSSRSLKELFRQRLAQQTAPSGS